MYFSRAVIQLIFLPPFDGNMSLDKGQAFHEWSLGGRVTLDIMKSLAFVKAYVAVERR